MTRTRRLAFGLLVVVLVLGSAELMARLITGPPRPLMVAPIPSGEGHFFNVQGDRTWTTYQGDFAVDPWSTEPGERPRLAFLGGSSVRGGRAVLTESQEAAARLGELVSVEALNLGAPGIDSSHLVELMPQVLGLQPSVIVIYTGHNDLGNAVFTNRYGDPRTQAIARARHVLGHSRIFGLLEARIGGRVQADALQSGPGATRAGRWYVTARARSAIVSTFERNLRWTVRLANQTGVPVVLATVASDPTAAPPEWACPDKGHHFGLARQPGASTRLPRLSAVKRVELAQLADTCSDLAWLQARLQLQEGPNPDAIETLDRLRDEDPLPMRASRQVNETIRSLAASEPGVHLADVNAAFRAQGHGIEPVGYFSDPMHLSSAGHLGVAHTVAPVVAQVLGLPAPELGAFPEPSKVEPHAPRPRQGR